MDTLPSRTAGPDKLAFLQTFGEQAQTISISPQDFNRVTPSAAKDKQVTGEGFSSSTCCTCSPRPLKGFTHISNAGNQPDSRCLMGRDHRPLPVSSRINTVSSSGEGFSSVMLPWRNSTLQELALTVLCEGVDKSG